MLFFVINIDRLCLWWSGAWKERARNYVEIVRNPDTLDGQIIWRNGFLGRTVDNKGKTGVSESRTKRGKMILL